MKPSAVLVDSIDFFRLDANRKLDPERRSEFGQFMTPPATAQLMASMFRAQTEHISLLDPGAGVGSLTAAFVSEICSRPKKPKSIDATAWEIDPVLAGYLADTLDQCRLTCKQAGVAFEFDLIQRDFIEDGVMQLRDEMFNPVPRFDYAILNPPYRKINSDSPARLALRQIGVETSNLYSGFLAVVLKLLSPLGELVAITPRSFCNGSYFKPFRELFLETVAVRRIHVFESRQVAFSEDDVLQENVIFHGIKGGKPDTIDISSSTGPEDDLISLHTVDYRSFVQPGDHDYFMHIVPDELGASVAEHFGSLRSTLGDLSIDVSTGRVVDFRATEFLRAHSSAETVPLIYPRNFENGYIQWPKAGGRKPEAMAVLPGAEELLVPRGTYVLVKRFSAKEEKRRVVAAIYDPERIDAEEVGFENHVNYYHVKGHGLPVIFAKGLTAFLNSTLVDLYFRQFSGHTQVNAGDLRNMKYPTREQLLELGSRFDGEFPAQEDIDRHLQEVLNLANGTNVRDPIGAKKKIGEALEALKAIGLPRAQLNERSALTLLSLLDLKPRKPWTKASEPLKGISQMMDFFHEHYGKRYAENSRESVRRQTIHQFRDAGIVSINPDDPNRPTNSGKTVYQIEPGLLKLLRTYGTGKWENGLKKYLALIETLAKKYAQERASKRIPIVLAAGKSITLSPGGQNVLVKAIIDDFCQYFTAGGKLVYVGDTDKKWAYFNEPLLRSLGVTVEQHGKMPDLIAFVEQKNWLVLIEAVTSHGPVNPKRRNELRELFKDSKAGLVFVTAFQDRRTMTRYLNDISWETEVWVAESPTHLIHFNGERFLGPYQD